MTLASVTLIVLLLLVVLLLTKPLGLYLADVMQGKPIWALLVFNSLGAVFVYLLQRLQVWLPLNPQHFANVSPDSAFNTAVSFITNTNWQGYSGESTMSYLTQMAGLAVQNFLSAATGIVVAIVLIRAFARHSTATIGNFWADVTRVTLYVLLPISTLLAIVFVSQGVVQNFSAYKDVTTVEALTYQQPKTDAQGVAINDAAGNPVQETLTTHTQTLPMGPIASQESIKELGTNGGGFVNANSAHPYENPTALSNFLQMLAILVIPASLTYTFGWLVGDTRQGWAVLAAMLILFVPLVSMAVYNEQGGNPRVAALGVDQAASELQSGGNMEGKEARFGIGASALFATVTTGTSCGAVNSMHDSYTPLGGFVPLFQMQLGEVVFGGVGTGLYSMLIFAIIGVFIAGLMIGRTPEYLGKKIEAFEMKMSSIAILVMPFIVLVGTAVAVSEILYAFTSAANNNGSAFGGISANTIFYNTALGLVMWVGRYWPIVAVLAIAGSLAAKKRVPVTAGTMPTHGPTFVILLIGTVLLVGALTFVPALALGPVVEHLTLWAH